MNRRHRLLSSDVPVETRPQRSRRKQRTSEKKATRRTGDLRMVSYYVACAYGEPTEICALSPSEQALAHARADLSRKSGSGFVGICLAGIGILVTFFIGMTTMRDAADIAPLMLLLAFFVLGLLLYRKGLTPFSAYAAAAHEIVKVRLQRNSSCSLT